jgi:hypothetical protein
MGKIGTVVGGALVGAAVEVHGIVGVAGALQAPSRNTKAMMNFFMMGNYMALRAPTG